MVVGDLGVLYYWPPDGLNVIFLVREAPILQLREHQLSIDPDLKGPCAPQARLDLDARVLLLHGTRQLQIGHLKAAGFTVLHRDADPAAWFDLSVMGRCRYWPHVPAYCCRLRSSCCFRVLLETVLLYYYLFIFHTNNSKPTFAPFYY